MTMSAPDAYKLMVSHLEACRELSRHGLESLEACSRVVDETLQSGETVEVEISAKLIPGEEGAFLVTAHVRGPSTWHHDYLQESMRVRPSRSAENA